MYRLSAVATVTALLTFAASSSAELREGTLTARRAAVPAGAQPTRSALRAALDRAFPEARALELTLTDDLTTEDGGRVVRFEQHAGDVPVLERGATIEVDARGAITVHAALAPRLPARLWPVVDRHTAARSAERVVAVGVDASEATLAVWPGIARTADSARLVWRLLPRADGLPFAPEILVDAETGRVVLARERARTMVGASMYRDNPARTPGLDPIPFPDGFAPSGEPLENETIAARTCVDRQRTESFGGDRVHACDLVAIARPRPDGTYVEKPDDDPTSAGRDEDAFAEVSMYTHLSRVYAFFRALAPPGTTRIVAGKVPFTAVANLRLAPGLDGHGDESRAGDPSVPLVPFANAFFAPANDAFGALYGTKGGGLWFGQGPRRDYAYDGDVVYHEFTHGVIDATMALASYVVDDEGLSAAPGALNEGLADYFSSALTGDPELGEYAAQDIAEGLPFVRSLANDDACARMVTGEVHFDSTAYSGALWEARASLSTIERVVFDRLVYRTLLVHPRFATPTFAEMSEVLLATLDRRSSLGARALRASLAARGFSPGCARVVEATDLTVASPTDLIGRVGFQAPGAFETGLALAPGVATFRSAVGPGTLVVRFGAKEQSNGGLFSQAGGTAYAPEVLVAFDAPIRWSGAKHDAPFSVAAKAEAGASGVWSTSVPVPEGARIAYVQIANRGDRSGTYDGVRLYVDPPPIGDALRPSTKDEPDESGSESVGSGGCAMVATARFSADALLPALSLFFGALGARRRRR